MNVFKFSDIEDKWERILEFYSLKEQYSSDTVKIAVDENNKSVVYDVAHATFVSSLFIEDGLKMLFDGGELVGRKVNLQQLKAISYGIFVIVCVNGGDEYTIESFCDYNEAYNVTANAGYYGSCMPKIAVGNGSVWTGIMGLGSLGGDCLCSGERVCHPLNEVCHHLTQAVQAYMSGDKHLTLRCCSDTATEVLAAIGHYSRSDLMDSLPECPVDLKWVVDFYHRVTAHNVKTSDEEYEYAESEPLSSVEAFDALSRFSAMLTRLLSAEPPIEPPSFLSEVSDTVSLQDIGEFLEDYQESPDEFLGDYQEPPDNFVRPTPLDFVPKSGQEELDFGWASVRLVPRKSWGGDCVQ